MDIQHMDFDTANGEHCIFGMNISEENGQTHINLFDLEENKAGPKVSKNIWKLSQHILESIFLGKKKRNNVAWSFTTGPFTTDIKFQETEGQPQKMILSDKKAFEWESLGAFSMNEYSSKYHEVHGKPRHEAKMEKIRVLEMNEQPQDFFAVPCKTAPEGVFYCKPEFHQGNLHDNYEYLMVDTKKLIAHLEQHDPKMLEHAKYKFGNDTPESWVENNSFEGPLETGDFAMINSQGRKAITMSSGNAGMLVLAQKLDLPFIPIQISKAYGMENIAGIKQEIGYNPENNSPNLKYKMN